MSNSLDRVSLQNPYRGSPPGARPIFVWAPGVAAVAEKIASILRRLWPEPRPRGLQAGVVQACWKKTQHFAGR